MPQNAPPKRDDDAKTPSTDRASLCLEAPMTGGYFEKPAYSDVP